MTAGGSLRSCALLRVRVCIYLCLIFALYCLCYAAAPPKQTLAAATPMLSVYVGGVGTPYCCCCWPLRLPLSPLSATFQFIFFLSTRGNGGGGAHLLADTLVVRFLIAVVVCLTLCCRTFSSYQFKSLICRAVT